MLKAVSELKITEVWYDKIEYKKAMRGFINVRLSSKDFIKEVESCANKSTSQIGEARTILILISTLFKGTLETFGYKKSPTDRRGTKCFHNGIILIVNCFQ